MSPPSTPRPPTAPRRPWRVLAGLTAAVLLAHALLLQGLPLALASHRSADAATTRTLNPSSPFTTRMLDAPVVPAAAPKPLAQRAAQARPAKRAVAAAATPRPATAGDYAPISESNSPLALMEPAQAATNTIADGAQVAASGDATPAPQTTDAAPAHPAPTPSPVPKPPAAQAVRHYAYPPSARLKYDIKGNVKGFPYFAKGELLWRQDGKTYDARMEISHFLLGSRVQTSTGQLTPQGLEPTRFGDKVRSEVAAHFERDKNKVSFSANTPDAPLQAGAQDQLSIFVQLAAMLGGAPGSFAPGTHLPFQAIGPRSSESWVFVAGALEKLVLPGGDIEALKLSRDPTGEYDPKVEVWLAPALGYLPVRIRLTQGNGDLVEQQWSATQKP